jgi:transcriptional regulator with XRE-family HTH domain
MPVAGIAGRVRAARRAAGMTQVELAAGRFTKQYVSQIERGEVVPSGELLT